MPRCVVEMTSSDDAPGVRTAATDKRTPPRNGLVKRLHDLLGQRNRVDQVRATSVTNRDTRGGTVSASLCDWTRAGPSATFVVTARSAASASQGESEARSNGD